MSDDETPFEKDLGGQLLASVSRSFYLTLKALPTELREPISLAYLLARTADTIADTACVPEPVRDACLRDFAALVQAPHAAEASRLAHTLAADFAPHQSDPAERRLMERLTDAIAWLRTTEGTRRRAIVEVLERIIAGQRLDIERFPGDGALRSLETADELDDYTWRVAGCVGEFWTQLCVTDLPSAFPAEVAVDRLIADGIRLGKGLQLVNILRDIRKDMALGRCYLPASEWRTPVTADATQLRQDSASLQPVWERWAAVCDAHLAAGLDYVCCLQHAKLRYATALPLVLAHATLRHLRAAPWEKRVAGAKISRLEVARLLTETLIANRSATALRAYLSP